jgi:hypothetical protein
LASCRAASEPARPAPIISILDIGGIVDILLKLIVNFCNATIYYSGGEEKGPKALIYCKSISYLSSKFIRIVALMVGRNRSRGNHASKNVFIFLERDDRWD